MTDGIRQPVHSLLQALHTRQMDVLKQLFWSELNYNRAGQPLSTRAWPDSARQALTGPPQIFATAGQGEAFHVKYGRLNADRLLLGPQRLAVTQLLREHPYVLFIATLENQVGDDKGNTTVRSVPAGVQRGERHTSFPVCDASEWNRPILATMAEDEW